VTGVQTCALPISFQYFNAKQSRWVFEKGEFEILVGASSKDIRLAEKIKM